MNDRISATYELGITKGTNRMIGEDGTFDPNGLVTRAQMASFIMRTMGHTNLRPAGLTAQSTNDDTRCRCATRTRSHCRRADRGHHDQLPR